MMGSLEWTRNSFARCEYHTYALPIPTKAKQIMSKYRPIAPKPTLPSSSSGSNSNASLNSHSRFTTRKGNNNSGSGLSNRARRKASECSNSPSPRAQKRVKVHNIAVDLASESSQIVGIIAQGSLPADGTKTLCSSNVCFRPDKDLDFMQIAAATAFTERSASGKICAGFGERFNIKETANSVGEVGMKDLSENMEIVPEQKLPQDRQSGCRSANYLVFPIVSGVDQEQEEARNLVTLPLLPEKPSPKDSIVGSPAGISTSIVGDRDLKSKVSYDEEEIQFRLFGRDFSIKDVGPCKSSSYESSKLTNCVPFADLLSIEKMYFGSHEAVILLLYNDNHGQDVLWSNPAYKGMVRALQCQTFTTNQPHTMIPVPIASFSCRSVSIGAVNSKAILWGFVENCTWPETERSPDHGIFTEHKLMPDSSSSSGRHHHNHTSMEIYTNAVSCMLSDGEGRTPINKSVITPQPVRPVGSCVSIENIKEANLQSSTIWKTMDEIEEHIEAETFPALVADSQSRVKCANSAYKKMVGQPECTWLESAAHYYNNKTEGSSNSFAMNRINGEIVLKHEIPLPTSAFSCCARIQWTNNKGEKTAIRAPCNVMKFVISNPISCVYAWKFHTAAAFSRS